MTALLHKGPPDDGAHQHLPSPAPPAEMEESFIVLDDAQRGRTAGACPGPTRELMQLLPALGAALVDRSCCLELLASCRAHCLRLLL